MLYIFFLTSFKPIVIPFTIRPSVLCSSVRPPFVCPSSVFAFVLRSSVRPPYFRSFSVHLSVLRLSSILSSVSPSVLRSTVRPPFLSLSSIPLPVLRSSGRPRYLSLCVRLTLVRANSPSDSKGFFVTAKGCQHSQGLEKSSPPGCGIFSSSKFCANQLT